MATYAQPGINPSGDYSCFMEDEKRIIKRFGIEWYVTHSGGTFTLGRTSTYRYFLIKPTEIYFEMFNIEREIVVIFSPYENLEPRTLDAIEYASQQYQSLRLEKICSIIVSRDPFVEKTLRDILKNEKESQVVIPFTYNELIENHADDYFMRNRLMSHFYSRDLFAFEGPLKSDLYFFGRNDLIHGIANRHKSNENSALFGLRKTGKTSVIFSAQRALMKMDAKSVFIDCQNPSFHRRRWNAALYFIMAEIKSQHKLDIHIKTEDKYTEEKAAEIFEKEILRVYAMFGQKNILLIFDEIENITFDISPSEHWASGFDFIYFWQAIRSIYQKLPNVFSYLIVGTNSMCVETPTIHGKDNPIFNQVPFTYIDGFDVPQTREMIRKLGRLMGLKFDEIIYGKLTEDFGGHPFLIRHVCSVINKISPNKRPVFVDKTLYEEGKKKFNDEYANYIEMILTVLHQYFDDEYEMLKYLANDDLKTFNEFDRLSPYYTNHLLGYGIVVKHNGKFSFRINSIKEYLLRQNKYQKLNMTTDEKWKEICERRNTLEINLRSLTKSLLHANFGKCSAKEQVLAIFGEPRKSKYSSYSLDELFDANKVEIYFEDIRKIICKYWDCFKNVFTNKQDFDLKMQVVNKLRADAHAKEIDEAEMDYFRVTITSLQNHVSDFLDYLK